jgi:hypothetical protein
MTTPWTIPVDLWAGETVAVLCAGPALTPDFADSVRHHPRIAVRRAFQFAPDADMLVSLDGPTGSADDAFWPDARAFAGLRVCGVECDVDALYAGMFYETVTLAEGHVIQIRNNGLAAIRIAARAGAAKILLLGFDPERYEEVHAHTGFHGLVQGLAQITAELRAAGIEVERIDSAEQHPGTRPPRRGELVDVQTFPQVRSPAQ